VSNRSNPIVYIVDDEQLFVSTLAAILRPSGFIPFGFVNPLEALRALESDDPALLMADVVMPHMTGIELPIQVKSKYPKGEIVLLSGQIVTAELLEGAKKQGHELVLLAKPAHSIDLLAAIKRLRYGHPKVRPDSSHFRSGHFSDSGGCGRTIKTR
jgi:FixJ family two-component response regulator